MPRSNRPRRGGRRTSSPGTEPLDVERAVSGVPRRESQPDGEWFVRAVSGPAAAKAYRCPGCDHEIPAGVAHLVVWSAEDFMGESSAVQDRRHWHRPCWTARGRRGPRRGRH